MRILTVAPEKYERHRDFLRQMHRLQATVFGERLAWEVSTNAGEERDQYDDCRPTYLLAVADGGKVAGCVRLLPASGSTMLEQPSPSFSILVCFALIQAWSRVRAFASILTCLAE
jgi:acyl homoserine lactone synthase